MSEKIDSASTSAGELDQRGRCSQNERLETETDRFQRILCEEDIRKYEAQLWDIIEGLRWLMAGNAPKWEMKERLLAQRAKLRAVERKLFHLRQRRLL